MIQTSHCLTFFIANLLDEILRPYGKEMTWDIKAGCMGQRKLHRGYLICIDVNAGAAEVASAEHLLSFFPDIPLTVDSFVAQKNKMLDEIWPTVTALPGVRKLVHHLKVHDIPIAVATSSGRHKYELKTKNLADLFGYFEGKVVCGDDKQYNMRGKPEPDIFITAAREMLGRNVGHPAEECTVDHSQERARGLVFEDSLPGIQAGKRAGMSGSFFVLRSKSAVYNMTHECNSCMGTGPKSCESRIFRSRKGGSETQDLGRLRARGVGFAALRRVAHYLANPF